MDHQTTGVEAAARAYFGKSVKDVDLAEAATLACSAQSADHLFEQSGKTRRPTRFGFENHV